MRKTSHLILSALSAAFIAGAAPVLAQSTSTTGSGSATGGLSDTAPGNSTGGATTGGSTTGTGTATTGAGPAGGTMISPPSSWTKGEPAWQDHVKRCRDRYASYDATTDTYSNASGAKQPCTL